MIVDGSGFLSREELLGGLPARRASTLLFAIEGHTAYLVGHARQAMARLLPERTAAERERAFLVALAQGRDLPLRPSIQDLERYAPQWAGLVPDDPGVRATVARLLGEKYTFTAAAVMALRRALGMDEPDVQAAFLRLHGRTLATIYATRLPPPERLRWLRSGLAARLEGLPPFWTAFALTLTETVGAGILALPIALAGVGPLGGVALLLALGLVNTATIAAISEAVVRSGNVRHGQAFFGRLVTDYLGPTGGAILSPLLLIVLLFILVAYYIGLSTTLAAVTGIHAAAWAALLCLIHLYVVRRDSLDSTVASALLVGAVNFALILLLVALVLPHVSTANLRYLNIPLVGGRPFDPSILALIFGAVLVSYFGHTSTGNCARVVLQRDPSGRSLIRGNVAAMFVAMTLYCLWTVTINGALPPAALLGQPGTALPPLAAATGPAVALFGLAYAILGMGLASTHYALALSNQVREWIPMQAGSSTSAAGQAGFGARVRGLTTGRAGRRWLGAAPLLALFVAIEGLLIAGRESFAGPIGFLGVIVIPLLAGVFPMLLLLASRRKGEYVPGLVVRALGHPVSVAAISIFFLSGIVLHGLVIWHDPAQRTASLLVVGLVVVALAVFIRQGAFTPRAVVELRLDRQEGMAYCSVTVAGTPVPARIGLCYAGGVGDISMAANDGAAASAGLRAASIHLPGSSARELLIWVHQLSPTGISESLPARVEVRRDAALMHDNLTQADGRALAPADGAPCVVLLTLISRSDPPGGGGSRADRTAIPA